MKKKKSNKFLILSSLKRSQFFVFIVEEGRRGVLFLDVKRHVQFCGVIKEKNRVEKNYFFLSFKILSFFFLFCFGICLNFNYNFCWFRFFLCFFFLFYKFNKNIIKYSLVQQKKKEELFFTILYTVVFCSNTVSFL